MPRGDDETVANYSHRFDVLLQTGEAEVVDDVPGADQKRDSVAL